MVCQVCYNSVYDGTEAVFAHDVLRFLPAFATDDRAFDLVHQLFDRLPGFEEQFFPSASDVESADEKQEEEPDVDPPKPVPSDDDDDSSDEDSDSS